MKRNPALCAALRYVRARVQEQREHAPSALILAASVKSNGSILRFDCSELENVRPTPRSSSVLVFLSFRFKD